MTGGEVRSYSWEDIRKHDKESDAWVVMDGEVFDVSKFLSEHPGGSSIVLPSLGTDIQEIFGSDDAHAHSPAAYDILRRYKIGNLAGAKKSQIATNGKSVQSDASGFKTSIDFTKPIVFQVGHLGTNYNAFVHRPQVLDEPARFFESDFLEFFSRTPWYVIPAVWLPVISGLVLHCLAIGMPGTHVAFVFLAGLFVWTFLEYFLHRFVFHLDEWMQGSYLTITLHFLMHGVHHLLPMDPMRLVFPPVLTCVLLCPIHATFRLLLPYPEAVCLTAGGLLGYVGYDLTHYYLHHSGKSWLSYFVDLKSYHLAHHYKQHRLGYGITSKLWDHVFGTVLHLDRPAAAPASGKAKAG